MIEKIYIPTYKRVGKQKTFFNLPEKYQKIATLVVREEEAELHGDLPITIIDREVTTIAETRKWIAYHAGDIDYVTFDDDLGFKRRFRDIWTHVQGDPRHDEVVNMKKPDSFVEKNPTISDVGWWKFFTMTEKDFDDMFNTIESWFDEGVTLVGLRMATLPLPRNYFTNNSNVVTTQFYSGSELPRDLIDWTSLPICEDVWVNMQLLEMGHRNRVSNEFCVTVKPLTYDNDEGCNAAGRTIELNNTMIRKLQSRWPNYVKVKKNEFKHKRTQDNVEELKFSCNYSRLYKDLHGKSIS